MLVLSRGPEEGIMIGELVEVRVLEVRGDRVRLGILAPPEVAVHRKEIFLTIQKENRMASASDAAGIEGALEIVGDGTAGAERRKDVWPGAGGAVRPAVDGARKGSDRGCPARVDAKRGRHAG